LDSLKRKFYRLEEIVSSIFLGSMTIIIGMQVFNRYVLQSSLVWSEELARYLFIWAVYMGSSYAVQEDRHLEISIFRNLLGAKLKKAVMILSYTLTILFCLFCVVYGIKMLGFLAQTGQKSPALEIQMYWVYTAIPVGMGLMGWRTCEKLWGLLSGRNIEYSNQLSNHLGKGV
jgi:C4-dicarboxylate transporter DctQ subunit